jgi:hypothetical protein
LAANLGMLPPALWNLWPLALIIIGLGLLITSDSDDWTKRPASKSASRKPAAKSTRKSSTAKKPATKSKKTTRRKK